MPVKILNGIGGQNEYDCFMARRVTFKRYQLYLTMAVIFMAG